MPLRLTGAVTRNSARWARIALITEVCWRMNRWRVRWSTSRFVARASWSARTDIGPRDRFQIASASAISFFCRLT